MWVVVTTEGIGRRLHAFGRPAEVAGTRGTAPSRRPRSARDASPRSRTRPWAPRGAGGLPRQGRHREAPRRRQGAARPPHAARVRRGDPSRQAPRRVRRARAGGVAAQADARERPRRGPRARGLLDEAGATGRHAREGHRPRVREVTGGQRDIFDRLGYGLPTTS